MFGSMINVILNLVYAYNLKMATHSGNNYQFQNAEKVIENRQIYISVNFIFIIITWRRIISIKRNIAVLRVMDYRIFPFPLFPLTKHNRGVPH